MNENRMMWKLFLNRIPGLSSSQKIILFDMFDGTSTFMATPVSVWKHSFRKTSVSAAGIEQALLLAEEDFMQIRDGFFDCLCFWDAGYPELLRHIASPPFALFFRGTVPDFSQPAVAIVGTRNAREQDVNRAYELAAELSSSGWMVISGLARGIDLGAHNGALDHQGITGAVLAGGVDLVYPKSSRPVGSRILSNNGFFLSEYSFAVPSRAHQFPVRNRIIAGLCRAVIVVSAAEKSGALITAEFALDADRELMVHADAVNEAQNEGITKLYLEGASPVRNAEDFFNALSGMYPENSKADFFQCEETSPLYGQGVL